MSAPPPTTGTRNSQPALQTQRYRTPGRHGRQQLWLDRNSPATASRLNHRQPHCSPYVPAR
ncbi:hypothetical protein KPSA1_01847 [Pseudomonas syringae pv. actinidiae]|uniref:Uncharacterized protein n=1 Tax=Pseudomonas syringae pv. actinidiae TaxID=103796 RepID=A0A2V0Q6P7_PSESF|nr:hypothetical protein KPSA1_01847 [Pseudomonas syringae pv. actinidiae]